jgi:iron complex outermembrane recepter protein
VSGGGSRHRSLLLALLAAGLALAVQVVQGAIDVAERDGPFQLPPWEVSESRLLPEAVPVRATALLPADAWSGRTIGTLAEAFRQIPGAVMQESFGGFEPPRISIRGSGIQSAPSSRGVALLLDRMPVGLADGSFNSALFDPQLGGEVQVQRGVDAWREAGAVLGGALDVRRKRAGARDGSVLRLDAGSFGGVRAGATGIARAAEVSGHAALSWARHDGFRESSAQQRFAFYGGGEATGPAGGLLSAGLYHVHARYQVPGPLTHAMAMTEPRAVSADVRRDRPRRDSALTRLAVGYGRNSTERELELDLGIGRTRDEFYQLRANGVTDSSSTEATWRGMFAQRFSSGLGPQQVRLRASGSHGWRRVARYHNVSGERGEEFARDALRPATTWISIEDRIGLARTLVASVGVAQLFAERPLDGQAGGRMRATLPQAGLTWQLTPRLALHGSIVAGAEPPAYDDLIATAGAGNVLERRIHPLALQRALTGEAGARGELGPLTWDLAFYRAGWRHEILRLADADGTPRGAVNATPTTHEGAEASVRWRLFERGVRIDLAASAVWTRCMFDADPVYGGNRLAGIPPHVGDAEIVAEFPRGLFVAAGADWVRGATAVDHAARLHYDGRTLAHCRGGWSGPSWTIFVQVRNVQDRRSIASTAGVMDLARNPASTAIFLPAAGRAWTVGWEWRR